MHIFQVLKKATIKEMVHEPLGCIQPKQMQRIAVVITTEVDPKVVGKDSDDWFFKPIFGQNPGLE